MKTIDLNKCPQTGVYVQECIINIPRTTFEHTHVQILDHSTIQTCILINVHNRKQKMFYRRKHGDGTFGIFNEVVATREVH